MIQLLYHIGDWEECKEWINELIQLDPSNEIGKKLREQILQNMDKIPEKLLKKDKIQIESTCHKKEIIISIKSAHQLSFYGIAKLLYDQYHNLEKQLKDAFDAEPIVKILVPILHQSAPHLAQNNENTPANVLEQAAQGITANSFTPNSSATAGTAAGPSRSSKPQSSSDFASRAKRSRRTPENNSLANYFSEIFNILPISSIEFIPSTAPPKKSTKSSKNTPPPPPPDKVVSDDERKLAIQFIDVLYSNPFSNFTISQLISLFLLFLFNHIHLIPWDSPLMLLSLSLESIRLTNFSSFTSVCISIFFLLFLPFSSPLPLPLPFLLSFLPSFTPVYLFLYFLLLSSSFLPSSPILLLFPTISVSSLLPSGGPDYFVWKLVHFHGVVFAWFPLFERV